jgi:hypothetical protein
MSTLDFEANILHGVNPQVYKLQRRLFNDQDLREKFHADWKAKRDAGLTMIEAIKRTRDEWLNIEETRK